MVFSSLLFLFRFLPAMLLAYYVAPRKLRNGVLFLGSLIFYAWGEPVYMALLLFSTLVDYVHGRLVKRWLDEGRPVAAKLTVASSVAINLTLLCIFKYADFLTGFVNRLLGPVTGKFLPLPGLALPIGISFYTFQTMSYTIDIYRREVEPQKSIIAFGAYVSMFPQLIAGPIVRYRTIAAELDDRREGYELFARGVGRFVTGLGKKVLIANSVGAVWTEIQGIPLMERSVLMVWIGILAFGMQIYFDFSGYSDMAAGLGYMMGFHFPENFHYPYMAKSITEFWRRWHISLGVWFKEYVYIPLGGNKKGRVRQVRNILAVWLLTGVWHGAAWNYLLWGLYFGLLLLLEKFVLRSFLEKLPDIGKRCYAMFFVYLGWVLFAHEDLGEGLVYLSQMFGLGTAAAVNPRAWYLLATNLPLFAAALLGSTPRPAIWWGRAADGKTEIGKRLSGIVEVLFLAAVLFLSTAYLVDASYNPFLYFRF